MVRQRDPCSFGCTDAKVQPHLHELQQSRIKESMTPYLQIKQEVTVKGGKKGIVTALDWHEGKIISFALEVDEPHVGKQVYHKRVEDVVA